MYPLSRLQSQMLWRTTKLHEVSTAPNFMCLRCRASRASLGAEHCDSSFRNACRFDDNTPSYSPRFSSTFQGIWSAIQQRACCTGVSTRPAMVCLMNSPNCIELIKTYRLFSPQLPPRIKLHALLDAYFNNVHPIRVFAFEHKPSFIRMLDEGQLVDA